MDNEKDVFAEECKPQDEQDPFGEAPEQEVEPKEEEAEVEPLKNRQARRMADKLQAEREANIALAERVKVLSEVKQFSKETGVDERLLRLYGSEEQGKAAAELHNSLLEDFATKAEERAYQRFENARQEEAKAQRDAESFIDNELESLEDEFNVDLTSNAPSARKARKELLETVQKLSPKDENGNIKDYADFASAFEMYQASKKEPSTQKKDLASRSMVRSGSSSATKLEDSVMERTLKDAGII